MTLKSYGEAFRSEIRVEVEYRHLKATPPQQLRTLRPQLSNPFLLHYCDILTEELDWGFALQMYQQHRSEAARSWYMGMVFASRSIRLGVGIVRPLDNAPYSVAEFLEKPNELRSTDLIGMGVGMFELGLADRIKPRDSSVFRDVVPRALRSEGGKLTYYQHKKWDHIQHLHDLYDYQARFYPHMRPER